MLPALLLATLLFPPAQAEGVPFHMPLPPGYAPFHPLPDQPEAWESLREGGGGRFGIQRFEAQAANARPAAVAEQLRKQRWKPMLIQDPRHILDAWTGVWAGGPAAGSDILYHRKGVEVRIYERLRVIGKLLMVGDWEGPAEEAPAARRALEAFQPPADWLPASLPTIDAARGGGPQATILPEIGTIALRIDASAVSGDHLEIEADYHLSSWLAEQGPEIDFLLPGSRRRRVPVDRGHCRLTYSVELGTDSASENRLGLYRAGYTLAGLDPGWLALPAQLAGRPGLLLPPAWNLELEVPPFDRALSWAPARDEELSPDAKRRILRFPELEAGRAWPFFLIGQFSRHRIAGREVWLRSGSKAHSADAPVRFLDRLSTTARAWLPNARMDWALSSFPGAGDRMLPGLILLDENRNWLREPLDARWGLSTRRGGLAELIGARLFGLQLRGRGSAAPFLETSLAEYAAAELLRRSQEGGEAEALTQAWRTHEREIGPLEVPLSRLDESDLVGNQRLLGRGALLWEAIARRCGAEDFAAVLNHFLARSRPWSTEELRGALEERTGRSWESFFQRFLYGREALPE